MVKEKEQDKGSCEAGKCTWTTQYLQDLVNLLCLSLQGKMITLASAGVSAGGSRISRGRDWGDFIIEGQRLRLMLRGQQKNSLGGRGRVKIHVTNALRASSTA